MILVVDMNYKKDSLAFGEFVRPIVSVINPIEECEVKHFTDVKAKDLESYSKIVLSGTALKDHATLKQLDKFNWIKTWDKPVLGICAGIQTISLVYGEPLSNCLQVGMTEISTLKDNPLFEGRFSAYALHNYSVQPSETFEVNAKSIHCVEGVKHKHKPIYGVLFHPEVRNQAIVESFVKLK